MASVKNLTSPQEGMGDSVGWMKNMVGLVFLETLRLTLAQWIALGMHTMGWLWYFRESRPRITPEPAGLPVLSPSTPLGRDAVEGFPASCGSRIWMFTAMLTLSGLWFAFWNTTTCVDTWCLFDQAQHLSPLTWPEMLDGLPKSWYVDKQPPFFTYWIATTPVLWIHQLVFFPWALLCAGLMGRLYGRAAALLLATPVFALIIHQPSNDVLLFGTLLIVLRLCQLSSGVSKRRIDHAAQRRHGPGVAGLLKLRFSTPGQNTLCTPEIFLAAVIYGLTWMMKPLTILTAPFILPQLGIAGLLSLVMWSGYVGWSLQWAFGRYQFRFLLQQLLITRMNPPKSQQIPRLPITFSAQLQKLLRRLRGALRWRWRHLGHKAVHALPFYLFPAYLRPWTWQGIVLAVVIILGYGQIKYLLLDLLFLFPVREEGMDAPYASS